MVRALKPDAHPFADSTSTDAAVAALYRAFPYPPPLPDLGPYLRGKKLPTFNPFDSWSLHFPTRPKSDRLDILVAGCGTRVVPLLAARMPQANIVGIDLSPASLAVSREQCARHGLDHVSFHELPLERVGELGVDFDVVHCHGVLHPLADPAAGLRALAAVTRPEGVISAMVYARYGRTGVYMLQDLAHRLGVHADDDGAAFMKALVQNLPDRHPLAMLPWGERPDLPIPEVADMLLHPRDRAYTVPDVRGLLDDAGLVLHRWLGHALYEPDVSPLAGLPALEHASLWDRAAAMELYQGRLITHSFLATHPSRPTSYELFRGPALVDAIPTLSPHLGTAQEGDLLVAHNRALQLPVHVRAPFDVLAPWLREVDGRSSVGVITWRHYQGRVSAAAMQDALALFERLYQADIIELRTGQTASR